MPTGPHNYGTGIHYGTNHKYGEKAEVATIEAIPSAPTFTGESASTPTYTGESASTPTYTVET